MYGHERSNAKELESGRDAARLSRWVLVRSSNRQIREVQMTDLLIKVFYVFAVLAVISFFVCTLPVWLIVLVVVLLLG